MSEKVIRKGTKPLERECREEEEEEKLWANCQSQRRAEKRDERITCAVLSLSLNVCLRVCVCESEAANIAILHFVRQLLGALAFSCHSIHNDTRGKAAKETENKNKYITTIL